jgi:hypothetical protein
MLDWTSGKTGLDILEPPKIYEEEGREQPSREQPSKE